MPRLLPCVIVCWVALDAALGPTGAVGQELDHAWAENSTDATKIHYAVTGQGPLVLFIHGYPDFWYGWIDQINALRDSYRCAALDLRGYNKSDKPAGLDSYRMALLVEDTIAVIKACDAERAVIVGHDWGGAIAWQLALNRPDLVDKLVICNLPHPRGLKRELLINEEHRANTKYARDFQDPEYYKKLSPEKLVGMLRSSSRATWSEEKTSRYLAAFARSDFKAMLSYYRRNYNPTLAPKPPLPYVDPTPIVKAKMPILMFHGLQDKALHHRALNNTWEWVEKDLTIVTLPNAAHWVHHDAAEIVSATIRSWLALRSSPKDRISHFDPPP